MKKMHLSTSFTMNGLTLEELKDQVDKATTLVKGSANVSVSVTRADRYWESDQYTINIMGETLE